MKVGSRHLEVGTRYLLVGLCLSLVGASPTRERASSGGKPSSEELAVARALPALAVAHDGSLSLEAAGRRFEFGQGQVAVSVEDSSWTYSFQGSRGGIRALSLSALPEQPAPDSVQYRHGEGIVERYVVQSRGVEQQFLLPGPYAGGDVLLTGSIQTDLAADVSSSFEGIAFRRDDVTVLYYGAAKAIDAAGRTALLEERWSEGELTIVVPASFLAEAKFPVLVDPFIGGRATVDTAIDLAQNPAVATTETSETSRFEALAVWSTDITSSRSIRGRIINPRGNTIVGPISAVNEFSGSDYTNPRVAWSFFDSVWVVAANGIAGGPNLPFIQVNKVDTAGTKTTGTNLNAGGALELERDVDVACNNSGQCLIAWAWDSDNSGSTDAIKGVFYTPGANVFGSLFDILGAGATQHSHPRIASNGTDYYVVFRHGTNLIEGNSVSTSGTVTIRDPSQSGTTRANPEVSYNSQLARYLVAWDTGSTVRGSTLTGATPPVTSTPDTQLVANATKPELTSQQYMGWTLARFNSAGSLPNFGLVRPALTTAFQDFGLDAFGSVVSFDVAHFVRGLSIIVYADDRGTGDHDILAREFIASAFEYADFDNDGDASGFVWRPGTNAYFYYNSDLTSVATTSVQFGTTGDIPVRMDFNGQGIPDLAVFRPSTGYWYMDFDRDGTVEVSLQFGASGDIPVPGDYDGDGRTDIAVFRPSTGYWYIRYSRTGTTISRQFGTSGDIPVPADYDGDYFTDIAVWRPSSGIWYVDTGINDTVNIQAQFGTSGDIPVPGDFGPSNLSTAPDGEADFAVFRPSTGYWYISRNRDGVVSQATQFGANGDIPVRGIFNFYSFDVHPFIHTPFAVFRPSNGTWYVDRDNNGTVDITRQFGSAGDIPMQQPSGQYRN